MSSIAAAAQRALGRVLPPWWLFLNSGIGWMLVSFRHRSEKGGGMRVGSPAVISSLDHAMQEEAHVLLSDHVIRIRCAFDEVVAVRADGVPPPLIRHNDYWIADPLAFGDGHGLTNNSIARHNRSDSIERCVRNERLDHVALRHSFAEFAGREDEDAEELSLVVVGSCSYLRATASILRCSELRPPIRTARTSSTCFPTSRPRPQSDPM